MDASFGVFEYEAGFGRDAKLRGSDEIWFGVGFAFGVVLEADERVEFIAQLERVQRRDHGVASAAGYNGERNPSVLRFDVLQDFRNRGELRQHLEIDVFFFVRHGLHGHVQSLLLVESSDNLYRGHASPGIELRLIELAIPFGENFLPGEIMQRHRVGDSAVAVEEIGAEGAFGEF